MASSERFVWSDASLCPLGCLAAQVVPLLLPLSDPGSRQCGFKLHGGVQEAAPRFESFLGGGVFMK